MPFLTRETGLEERPDQLGCHVLADHPAAQAEHVDVVVLDCLVGGVGVVCDSGPDAVQFVGGDAGTCAGPADDDAALGVTSSDRLAHRCGEIGIVHGLLRMSSDVDEGVAVALEQVDQELLEGVSGVIGSHGYSHGSRA